MGRWIGAVEGYYGPPLEHRARLDLVRWLGGQGFNCYAYAPKDDSYHRAQWREPYPKDRLAEFEELLATGAEADVAIALVVSPGLDFRDGDEAALAAKLGDFRRLGAEVLGVAWDDVPPGGADLGERHAKAVAAAVAEVGDGCQWVTCPTDYSGLTVTPYLQAYADALPAECEVMWTGPGIVSPYVSGAEFASFSEELGRPVVFAENFPVNDGAMAGVLHIGPYPRRDPGIVELSTGVFCNFMSRPLASRVGLGVAARWWRDPQGDREAQWKEVLDDVPGITPLAKASRSWIGDEGPDDELSHWVQAAVDGSPEQLRNYLFAGCRRDLPPELEEEIEPWLVQWDFETQAMQYALVLLSQRPARPASTAFILSELWRRAVHGREQLFGIRWAFYPVTERRGEDLDALPGALASAPNLTDVLCRAALGL